MCMWTISVLSELDPCLSPGVVVYLPLTSWSYAQAGVKDKNEENRSAACRSHPRILLQWAPWKLPTFMLSFFILSMEGWLPFYPLCWERVQFLLPHENWLKTHDKEVNHIPNSRISRISAWTMSLHFFNLSPHTQGGSQAHLHHKKCPKNHHALQNNLFHPHRQESFLSLQSKSSLLSFHFSAPWVTFQGYWH